MAVAIGATGATRTEMMAEVFRVREDGTVVPMITEGPDEGTMTAAAVADEVLVDDG